MRIRVGCVCLVAATLLLNLSAHADELDDLARDFWQWRTLEQPVSNDDIPRLERPADWVPNWSPEAVARYRKQLLEFETRWTKIDAAHWPVPRQVDYRLMGSAIARVRWELEITHNWQRHPMFYVDQTVGAYFHLLLPPPPFTAARMRQVIAVLDSFPATIDAAQQNLTQPVGPFAQLALTQLRDIRPRMQASIHELQAVAGPDYSAKLDQAAGKAIVALESYREWITRRQPSMPGQTAVGRDAYVFFLKNVALIPYPPEEILQMGRSEWARSVAFQTYEEHRNLGQPQLRMARDEAEEMARVEKDELAVRRYLETHDLLTVPVWMEHYRFLPLPGYLSPLSGIGEEDDFTGPGRLKDPSTRYIVPPSPDLGYFSVATAKDTRPDLVHEGVPGHYFQLAMGWADADPMRRHYYDSGANEGIGFYAEEMMQEAGLFDDSPRTREIIDNFMRLRALRVEVDVKLALGEFTIDQAAEYLMKTVPMDMETAHHEGAFFATAPGQAISYQIGKLQIMKFLADARRQQGDDFKLRAFHDFLWQNGNVPISLQRWEYLGLKDDVDALDKLH